MKKQDYITEFSAQLKRVIDEFQLESALDFNTRNISLSRLLTTIESHFMNVGAFVEFVTLERIKSGLATLPAGAGLPEGPRLVVAPVSPLFAETYAAIAGHFPNICFVDAHRGDMEMAGHTIVASAGFEPRPDDCGLIITRNTQAMSHYSALFKGDRVLNMVDHYLAHANAASGDDTSALLTEIHKTEKPVLFTSARPLGTLSSTVRELGRNGFTSFWLGAEHVKERHQIGYSTPRVADMAFADFAITDLAGMIEAMCKLEHGTIFLHYEELYPPQWDFERISLCYAAAIAIQRTIHKLRTRGSSAKLALYMYDAIKPAVKGYALAGLAGRLYRTMLAEAEAIIFSSYTEAFGDLVENAMQTKLPRVHWHRYQVPPDKRRDRLKDGYHIAIISVMLEEFWEPSRMGIVPLLRDAVRQGMHIHYYTGNTKHPKLEEFRQSLPADKQHHFHLHEPIHDLEALANELSAYHLGWSLLNMQIFNDMTTYIEDPFMRDALSQFTPTTLPSVIWTSAAAGLPILCNRDMRAVVDELPDGFGIPMTFSEVGNLKTVLDGLDWQAIDDSPLDSIDITKRISVLTDFLDQLHQSAPMESCA